MLPLRPVRNMPGSSTFAARKQIPAPAGSVAAAWQAAAHGKQFHAFALGRHRSSLVGIVVTSSSPASVGTVHARSPIRTAARKSVVGSPRSRHSLPSPQRPPPAIGPFEKPGTYANEMASKGSTYADQMVPSVDNGATYADQMARVKSILSNDPASPKSGVSSSPTKLPKRADLPSSGGLDGSRYTLLSPRC